MRRLQRIAIFATFLFITGMLRFCLSGYSENKNAEVIENGTYDQAGNIVIDSLQKGIFIEKDSLGTRKIIKK